MSSIRRSSLISITLGLLTVIGAIFRSLPLRRRQDNRYGAGRPVLSWRWTRACFSIYRTSSMPAFGLGRCDRCHRLLFE